MLLDQVTSLPIALVKSPLITESFTIPLDDRLASEESLTQPASLTIYDQNGVSLSSLVLGCTTQAKTVQITVGAPTGYGSLILPFYITVATNKNRSLVVEGTLQVFDR